MNETSKIKRFFMIFSWIFKPFLWYIIGVTFIEQLLYWLFLQSVKLFADKEVYYNIFRFIATNRYALFPMISGIIMTSFFIRLYREDWKLRVRNENGILKFNEDEAGTGVRTTFINKLKNIKNIQWIIVASAVGCIILTVAINLFKSFLSIDAAMEEAAKLGAADLIVLLPATLIIAPVFEELFFRGITFRRAKDRMGFVPAAVLSAFIFAFLHDNAAQFILAFAMGILFAYIYDLYNSLLPAVIAHIAANAAGLLCSTELFGRIFENKGIIFLVLIVICVSLIIYSLKKLKENKGLEYVLFSSIESEDNV